MSRAPVPIRIPDLSTRPFSLTVEHQFPFPTSTLYVAWTERFELWFAAPGSVLMQAAVNAPFFFETEYTRKIKLAYNAIHTMAAFYNLSQISWYSLHG